jgi:cytochrome c553
MLKKMYVVLSITIVLVSLRVTTVRSDSGARPGYIGSKMCIMCHKNRDDSADWWQNSKFASAFDTLGTDKAKKFSKNPQKAPACVQCHVVGFEKPGGYSMKKSDKDNANLKGVGCEDCHGPGSEYKKVMMRALRGKWDDAAGKAAGLVIPGNDVCITCHNKKSPSFKPFKYKERVKLIQHGTKKK